MKILIVTHYFTPHVGGIEIVAYNEAKELIKKGHYVTIVTSRLENDPKELTIENIVVKRIKALNFLERKFGIPYPLFSPKLLWVLNNEVKNSDVIHVHGAIYLGALVSALFAKLYKKNLITTEHVGIVKYKSDIVTNSQKLAFQTIGKIVLDSSSKVLVINKTVKNYLSTISETPIDFLFNGVDTDLFKPVNKKRKLELRKKYNLPKERKLVLFVGRFVQKKGIDILLQSKSDDYDLILAGNGVLPTNVYQSKGIHVFNSLSQDKLAEIYQASDLFVLPSRNEGFPLSLQEAMASGLSVITSKENINHKTNLDNASVSVKLTPQDINQMIISLLKNNDLLNNLSSEARKLAVNEFSWSEHSNLLLNFINK